MTVSVIEIDSREPVVRSAARISVSENTADGRFVQDPIGEPGDGKIFGIDVLGAIYLHIQKPDVEIANAAGQFAAGEDVDHFAIRAEPNPTRVKGQWSIRIVEPKKIRVLQKEIALLREKKRESREVNLARIYFCFGEICVHSQRSSHRRRDAVEGVHARFEIESAISLAVALVAVSASEEWFHLQPDSLTNAGEVLQLTEVGQGRNALVPERASPAINLLFPANLPLDIKSPNGALGIEGEALERNRNLGRPTFGIPAALAIPDGVPFHV